MLSISVLIYLREYPGIQILILYFLSMLYQLYLVMVKPYEENLDNYKALFNESLVSLYALSFIGLTDITYSIEVKNVFGII